MLLRNLKPKLSHIFKYLSLACFFLFSQPYVSDILLYPLEHKHDQNIKDIEKAKPDYILVLACYYSTFGEVPDISRWTECSLQRNIEAIKLHRATNAPIIITGGNFLRDPNTNYSQKAKEFFLSLGVQDSAVIITGEGTNTAEEILSAKNYLNQSMTWVVSSATHIARLQNTFDHLNFKGKFFPVNHQSKGIMTPYLTFPSASALKRSELAFYEYAALLKQKLAFGLEK